VLTEGARLRQQQRHRGGSTSDVVSIDTFYIGKIKDVSKVWQVTACDAASLYGFAQIATGARAAVTPAFLHERIAPACRAAGGRCDALDFINAAANNASFPHAETGQEDSYVISSPARGALRRTLLVLGRCI
jgi:hypothetical protein